MRFFKFERDYLFAVPFSAELVCSFVLFIPNFVTDTSWN